MTAPKNFVHLRSHTEFSVVDGTLRIDDAVDAAAKDGQAAMAITDLSNLFGGIKFYSAARSQGVKPILGAEILLAGLGADGDQVSRVLLLANRDELQRVFGELIPTLVLEPDDEDEQ